MLGLMTAAPFPHLILGGSGSSKSPSGEWEAQHPAGNTAQIGSLLRVSGCTRLGFFFLAAAPDN